MFAFGGLATYPKAGRDQPFQVSDSLLNALLAVNQHRQPLSECPANRPALQAVNSDTLAILFQGHHDGWERFRQR